MPQLDVTTYTSQIFWLFVCFTTLLVVSIRVMLPRLTKILNEREERIEGKKELAATLKKRADDIQRAFEQHLIKVRKESHEEILKAVKSISVETEKAKREISSRIKERFLSHEAQIADRKDTAIKEIQEIAQSVTETIVQHIGSLSSPRKEVKQAVAETLTRKVVNGH
jgi:F-type H+-transporting ATPase subunit b